MPYFSKRSSEKLDTCHKDLILICSKAIEIYDFSVLCGYRNKEEQAEAFKKGYSKVNYPLSRHNHLPSNAIDLAPYPIDFKDINRFYKLAGIIKAIAYLKGIKIKWGGEWTFKDYPHFQLEKL